MHSGNTKKIIVDTFFELAKKKNVDKITVKELVSASGISRQTFYYHFQDILDVMEKSLEEGVRECLKESLRAETAEGAILVFIKRIKENRALIMKINGSQRRNHLEEIFVQSLKSCLTEMIRRKTINIKIDYLDMEAAVEFFSYGFVNYMLAKCVETEIDEEAMAKQICRIITGEVIKENEKKT